MEGTPKWYQNKLEYDKKYQAQNYKQKLLRIKKKYYEEVVEPAVKKSGESVNEFINKAIEQRIERENL